MKRFSEQFKKQSETIRLVAVEKAVLRDRLVTYMEYHPMPQSVAAPVVAKTTVAQREPFFIFNIPARFTRGLVAVCTIGIVVGVPALAEQAVPGDLLYPMKVQVNEEVVSSFTGAGYEKVAWETKRIERRISEARILAKEGRLTAELEADVIAAVAVHQESTKNEIATLRTTDVNAAALAELTFASVLDVQSAALKAQDTGSTTQGMSTVALAIALDEAQAQVIEESSSTELSYEHLVAKLEQETTRGRELLASIRNSATEQEYIDIERRLSDIERKITDGASAFTTNTDMGVESLKATWRDMQVVITFMTDIDVRSALALESLVPMVLTPDEERVLLAAAYSEAEAQVLQIEKILPQVTDTGVSEKVNQTLPRIKELLETATTTGTTDILTAKSLATEALEYTRSIVALPTFAVMTDDTDPSILMSTMAATTSTSTSEDELLETATTTDEEEEVE
ncbi:MAG: hypothetical protein RLZZ70_656 [Candidatus Parcubacteria bacterium]|jgi:hypothetical protein